MVSFPPLLISIPAFLANLSMTAPGRTFVRALTILTELFVALYFLQEVNAGFMLHYGLTMVLILMILNMRFPEAEEMILR